MTITRYLPGQRIAGFPATSWDEVADFVERDQTQPPEELGDWQLPPGDYLHVVPNTDVGYLGVLSLQAAFKDPNVAGNESYKKHPPVLSAIAPLAQDASPVVAVHPITADKPGWVMVAGTTWCDVDITDEDHEYAKTIASDKTKLTSSATDSGPRILWKPSGTGVKTCAVVLCASGTITDPPGAPLDGPTAVAIEREQASDNWLWDATRSTVGYVGQSLTTVTWSATLTGSHAIQISGTYGSSPTSVIDTRNELTAAMISGNIEAITVDWDAANLSNASFVAKQMRIYQTDGQNDTDSLPLFGAEPGRLRLAGKDAGLQPNVWQVFKGQLQLPGKDVSWNPWPVAAGQLRLPGKDATLRVHALDFSGATDNVDAGSDSSLDDIWASGATVVAYILARSDGGSSYGRIAGKESSDATRGWGLMTSFESGGACNLQYLNRWTGNDMNTRTTTQPITNDTWFKVAAAYSSASTANRPTLYVWTSGNPSSATITHVSTPTGTAGDAAEDMIIGNRGGLDRNFDGQIGWVRLYDKILNTTELGDLSSVSANLIESWEIDEDTGSTTAASQSSPTNDGTITGATWV